MIGKVGGLRIVTIAVVLGLWELLARSELLYEGVVPPLELIIIASFRQLTSALIYRHLATTGLEIAIGFPAGLLSGVALGVLMGARRFFGRAVMPYVETFATAPKIILLPIAMLLFGTGPESKMALGALSCFFPVVLNTAAGMRHIDPVLIRVGRSFNLTRWQMVSKIYLPALRQAIVTGMRLGLGLTVIGILLAEIKLSNRGLGYLANEYYNNFRIPDLYALLIFIFVLSIGANALISRLQSSR